MSTTKVVEKIKTYVCLITFFRKPCHLLDCVEKYARILQAAQYTITRRLCFACCINRAADIHYNSPLVFCLLHK